MPEKIRVSDVLRILQTGLPSLSSDTSLEERTLVENTVGLEGLYTLWPEFNELTPAQVLELAELVARAMMGTQVQKLEPHVSEEPKALEFAARYEALSPIEKYLFIFAKYIRSLDDNVNVYNLYLTKKKQAGDVLGIGFRQQIHEVGFSQYGQNEISALSQPQWKGLAWSHVNMTSQAINLFSFYWQHDFEKPTSAKIYTTPESADLTLSYARTFLRESLDFTFETSIDSWYNLDLMTNSGREATQLIPRQRIYLEMFFLDLGDEDLLELVEILRVTNKRVEFTNKYRDLLRARYKARVA